jgi:tetratricopeptide (TPR) repeat protein
LLLLAALACSAEARNRVVVIGVGSYHDANTPSLLYADHDASRFEKYLGKKIDPQSVLLNTGKTATLPEIEYNLNAALTQAAAGDTICIFISARGIARAGSDGYIGTTDLVSQKPGSGGLPIKFLRTLIERSDAARVLLFVDVNRPPPDKVSNLINQRVAELGSIPKPAVGGILATEPRQVSFAKDDLGSPPDPRGYGVFGFYLVDANAAAGLNVTAMYNTLLSNVPRETGGKQKPANFGNMQAIATPLLRSMNYPVHRSWNFGIQLAALAFPGLFPMQAQIAISQLGRVQAALGRDTVSNPNELANDVLALKGQMASDDWEQLRQNVVQRFVSPAQEVVDRYGMQDLLPDDPLRVSTSQFADAARAFSAASQLFPERSFEPFADAMRVRQHLCEALSLGTVDSFRAVAADRTNQARVPETENVLGIHALEQKNYPEAIKDFTRAKNESPAWIYPRHNLALAYIESGNSSAAEREYREAIAVNPSEPYLYYNLGLLLHRMNRRKEAGANYKKALSSYTDAIQLLSRRANEWTDEGLPEDAQRARERIRIFERNKAEVLNAWGALLAGIGDSSRARGYYNAALFRNPMFCEARDNLAQLEPVPEALRLLQMNEQQCPKFHPSFLKAGRLHLRAGDSAAAFADFDTAHQLVPQNLEALEGLASAAAARKDYPQAIRVLKDAIALAPYPSLYVDLAEAYRQTGDADTCRKNYQLAIENSTRAFYNVSKKELRKRSAACAAKP